MKHPKHVFDIQKLINGEYSSKELREKCEELKMEREVVNAVGPFFNISILKALKNKHIDREDALALLANLVNMRIEEYMSSGDSSETIEKLEHDMKLIRNELSEKDLIILARDEQITSLQNSIEDLRSKMKKENDELKEQLRLSNEEKRYLEKDLEKMRRQPAVAAVPKILETPSAPHAHTVTTGTIEACEFKPKDTNSPLFKIDDKHKLEAAELINDTMNQYVRPNGVTDRLVCNVVSYYISHFLKIEDNVFKYKELQNIEKNLRYSSGKDVETLPTDKRVEITYTFNCMITHILKAFEARYGVSVKEVYETTDTTLCFGKVILSKEFVVFIVGSLLRYLTDMCKEVPNIDRAQLYYSLGYIIIQSCDLETLELIHYKDLKKTCGVQLEVPDNWSKLYGDYCRGNASAKYISAVTKMSEARVYALLYRTRNGIHKTRNMKYNSAIKEEVLCSFRNK